MRAIVVKELKENVRWLPVGIAIIGICAWNATPIYLEHFAAINVERSLMLLIAFGASLFAIGLAILQSAFDFSARQRGFLFHRAVSRQQIICGKIVAGGLLFLPAIGIPLAAVAIWFFRSGPEYLPVHPIQVLPATGMALACFLFHPATILTFERQASWFGTKLLPLFAICWMPIPVVTVYLTTSRSTFIFATTALVALIAASVVYAAAHTGAVRNWYLALGAVVACIVATFVLMATIESLGWSSRTIYGLPVAYGLDSNGKAWMYRYEQRFGNSINYQDIPITGDQIVANQSVKLDAQLPPGFSPRVMRNSVKLPMNVGRQSAQILQTKRSERVCYDFTRGQILVYDLNHQPRLQGYLSKDGFHPYGEGPGLRFHINPYQTTLNWMYNNNEYFHYFQTGQSKRGFPVLWADLDGVYQLDPNSLNVKRILDGPVTRCQAVTIDDILPPWILVESDKQIRLCTMEAESGDDSWYQASIANAPTDLPALRLKQIAVLPRLPNAMSDHLLFGATQDGKLVAVDLALNTLARFDTKSDSSWTVDRFSVDTNRPAGSTNIASTIAACTFPQIVVWFVILTTSIARIAAGGPVELAFSGTLPTELLIPCLIVGVLTTLASMLTAGLACQRRGFSIGTTILWCGATLFLGTAGPLTVVALYRRPTFEPCPRCEKLRNVEQHKCQHCNTAWEAPTNSGIEIFEQPLTRTRRALSV